MDTVTKIVKKLLGEAQDKADKSVSRKYYPKKRVELLELKAVTGSMEVIREREAYCREFYE